MSAAARRVESLNRSRAAFNVDSVIRSDADMWKERTSIAPRSMLARRVPCLRRSSSRRTTGLSPEPGCVRSARTRSRPVLAAPSTTTGCPHHGRCENFWRMNARTKGTSATATTRKANRDGMVPKRAGSSVVRALKRSRTKPMAAVATDANRTPCVEARSSSGGLGAIAV